MVEGLEKLDSPALLPQDIAIYLLGLKRDVNLPQSVLTSSSFKKPLFRGRKDFFGRLAAELQAFGLAYQRVYLKPPRLSKIASLFHIHRPWWQCDIKDIEGALQLLQENAIVQKTPEGEYLFEPLTLSKDVNTFLGLIRTGVNDYGEIPLTRLQQLVPWDKDRIDKMITLLASNRVCLYEKTAESLYFPDFRK